MGCCTRHRHGERTSISVWCSHVGAPAWEIKSEHVADGQRCWHSPGGKNAKKPLRGYLCPLTTGGLISVRPCCAPDSSPAQSPLVFRRSYLRNTLAPRGP